MYEGSSVDRNRYIRLLLLVSYSPDNQCTYTWLTIRNTTNN